MLYKEDWDAAAERMKAWWAGETADRPVIQVTAPRDGSFERSDWDFWYLVRHPDDPDGAVEEFEKACRATFFGGDAFPNLVVNLGPGILAAYLGGNVQVAEDTVWFEPLDEVCWNDIFRLDLDDENKWWRLTRDLTSRISELGEGKFFTSVTDLNAVLNVLGHLRGTQRLLQDLVDDPISVKEACWRIHEMWFACYDALADITLRHMPGTTSWMGVWFPGRGSDVQCDFAAMISPRMFEEFVVPVLSDACARLDQSVYHLDGPGQICHLDLLLDMPELDGIQWVPGAGKPGCGSPVWFDMYKRIQEHHKLLVLPGVAANEVAGVVEALSPDGLLIQTYCSSEAEAREVLKTVQTAGAA